MLSSLLFIVKLNSTNIICLKFLNFEIYPQTILTTFEKCLLSVSNFQPIETTYELRVSPHNWNSNIWEVEARELQVPGQHML